jgi:transcriptional regulator with XRE-family HTH domain
MTDSTTSNNEKPRAMSASQTTDAPSDVSDKVVSRAIGEELRREREAGGWSRAQFVRLLPSGIGDRTLLAYEHGLRHHGVLRLMELCNALGVDVPSLLARAFQRAHIHLENLPLKVDLRALLKDSRPMFRPLRQWAQNTLNGCPDGVTEVTPVVVRNLALFMGCTHEQLAKYLAGFLPGEEGEDADDNGRAARP